MNRGKGGRFPFPHEVVSLSLPMASVPACGGLQGSVTCVRPHCKPPDSSQGTIPLAQSHSLNSASFLMNSLCYRHL